MSEQTSLADLSEMTAPDAMRGAARGAAAGAGAEAGADEGHAFVGCGADGDVGCGVFCRSLGKDATLVGSGGGFGRSPPLVDGCVD